LINIIVDDGRWYEEIKRNEEECPKKINKESWVEKARL